jgi:hypothetical protein
MINTSFKGCAIGLDLLKAKHIEVYKYCHCNYQITILHNQIYYIKLIIKPIIMVDFQFICQIKSTSLNQYKIDINRLILGYNID